MDDAGTGTWEYTLGALVAMASYEYYSYAANWAYDNQGTVMGFGASLLLCGMAMLAWNYLKRPIRRLHHRWSARNLRVKMAKWKEEVVAEIFYDALTKACDENILSKHHKRKLMGQLAEFFGMKSLKKPKMHPEAIKRRNEALKEHLKNEATIGPKGIIPGGKPGENVVPLYQSLGSDYLARKKSA